MLGVPLRAIWDATLVTILLTKHCLAIMTTVSKHFLRVYSRQHFFQYRPNIQYDVDNNCVLG